MSELRHRVQLELEAVGGARWQAVEPMARLRRALKALGRLYGWRVTSIRSVLDVESLDDGQKIESEETDVEVAK